MKCRVLDIDYSKKIADLKELTEKSSSDVVSKSMNPDHKTKVIVELNKDGYLVVSVKSSRSTLGLCIHSNFNSDGDKPELDIGEEIEVKVHNHNKKGGFYELIYIPKVSASKVKTDYKGSQPTIVELKQGIKFTGQIKSIKAQCIFV